MFTSATNSLLGRARSLARPFCLPRRAFNKVPSFSCRLAVGHRVVFSHLLPSLRLLDDDARRVLAGSLSSQHGLYERLLYYPSGLPWQKFRQSVLRQTSKSVNPFFSHERRDILVIPLCRYVPSTGMSRSRVVFFPVLKTANTSTRILPREAADHHHPFYIFSQQAFLILVTSSERRHTIYKFLTPR